MRVIYSEFQEVFCEKCFVNAIVHVCVLHANSEYVQYVSIHQEVPKMLFVNVEHVVIM